MFGNFQNIQFFVKEFGPLPSIQELEKSISVVFVNTHRSLIPPRPTMPGMIDIAGAHVRPPKTLPNDIQVKRGHIICLHVLKEEYLVTAEIFG